MNKMDLDFFINAGYIALKNQKEDGSMPCGKNGPHDHNMTSARNTGHFSILFLFLYQKTSDTIWKISAQKALNHLMTLRPLDGSFWHRKHQFKSSYNGLIGQAWSLEALIAGYFVLGDKKYLDCAKKVINLHKFDEKQSLWYEVDLDGSLRPINMTLNQQIWFTAMAAKVCYDDPLVKKRIKQFVSNIKYNMKQRKNGLLYTQIYKKNIPIKSKIAQKIWKLINPENREEIDVGYHAFTLTGLAMLYELLPENEFFKGDKFIEILNYCFSNEYLAAFEKSKYGYEYNVIGFELPYIWSVFHHILNRNALENSIKIYKKQLEYYSSETDGLLACNSFDTETLAARIYEVYRINDSFWRKIS